MRVTTFGTERNPYGADAGDVRLGCGALNTIDLKTWMVFDFFVSGSRIVALYERLPFGQSNENPYPAFTELIPIAVATSPGEWHRYAICYDRAERPGGMARRRGGRGRARIGRGAAGRARTRS